MKSARTAARHIGLEFVLFLGRVLVTLLMLSWLAIAAVSFVVGVLIWIFILFPFREGKVYGEQIRKYMAAIGPTK